MTPFVAHALAYAPSTEKEPNIRQKSLVGLSPSTDPYALESLVNLLIYIRHIETRIQRIERTVYEQYS